MENIDFLKLLFTVLLGGGTFLFTVVTATFAAYRFVQKEIEKKLTKHFLHEHLLDKQTGQTLRDRLVECKRLCPAQQPVDPPAGGGGGGRDTRGLYSRIGGRS